jgi:hypothetical protein
MKYEDEPWVHCSLSSILSYIFKAFGYLTGKESRIIIDNLFILSQLSPLGIATVANWTANAIVVASYLSVAEAVGEQSTFIMFMVRSNP